MEKPNLFVVGFERTGTSLLYNVLLQSELIGLPFRKEPHFFDYNFDKGEQWYLNYWEDLEKPLICDITPNYIQVENIADKIFSFNSDAKIIIILRNPIDLVISTYFHEKRTIKFKCDFLKYWGEKANRNKFLFFEKINQFFTVFPKENVGVFIFEENIRDYTHFFKKLSSFLGYEIIYDTDHTEKINESYVPNFRILYDITYIIFDKFLRNVQSKMVFILKNRVKRYGLKLGLFSVDTYKREALKINKRFYSVLKSYYENDINETSELINKDLSSIWFK